MKLERLYTVNIPSDVDFKETSKLCGDIGDQPNQRTQGAHIFLNTKLQFQTMNGIGGAFSELGSKALFSLTDDDKETVSKELFEKFASFRLPIGSSDFGLDAYSLNDNEDDFEMEKFSLARDEQYIIPYMEMAKKYADDVKIHASPWAPPYWFKDTKQACGAGSLVNDDKYYKAYAKYFATYIKEYAKKGFNITRLNIQNEPEAHPKYPGCDMTVEEMAKLIRYFIHPMFKEEGIKTEIFAGTFRAVNEATATEFLSQDDEIQNYVDGIGCQYSTMQPLYEITAKYPKLKLMHTESNCFRGENSWPQAIVLYTSIVNYMNAGCDTFTYWNMILNTNGESTWGWRQNSLVTIDEEAKTYTYNPDFYVYKLAKECIASGSKRISYASRNKLGIAFKNEDGSVSFMVSNFSDKEEVGDVTVDGVKLDLTLAPMSISAFKIS
ncbi:MAG: hypothetical protein R3Y35_13075 [Clostridia bacterium]